MIVGNAALGVPCIANKQNEPIVGEPALGLPIEIIRLSREGEGALPYIMLHKLCERRGGVPYNWFIPNSLKQRRKQWKKAE